MRATRGLVVLVSFLSAGCSGAPSNDLVGNTSHGSVDIQFADTEQSNVESSYIRANEVTVLVHDAPSGTLALYVAGFRYQGRDAYGGASYKKEWQLAVGLHGEPSPGKTYAIDPAQPAGAPDTATLVFEDRASWRASGGSITVQSLVSRRASFSLDAVTFEPQEYATGTFSMSGTITIANIDDACDCIE